MDTGRGELAMLAESKFEELREKEADGLWRVGQIVEVNGSRLRVQSINRRRIVMKILPKGKLKGE